MTSIKDIAALANVSQGTASIVLNGKGEQYRISAATQQKIYEAARQLNYQPNISARRLRSGGETVLPIIALFWTLDTRAALIGRFLKGLQEALPGMEHEYELLIQPYVGSKLNEVRSLRTGTRYNGAIIANPTVEDEKFLEAADLQVPIVLYQRESTKYSYVNVDSYQSGCAAAVRFAERGHRHVGIIKPNVSSSAVSLRVEGFLSASKELGMQITQDHIIASDFSEHGGYLSIQSLYQRGGDEMPSALFVVSDQMAVGVLAALEQLGKRIPEDVEIIGYDDDDVARYTVPPLSTIHLPVEEMAIQCLQILFELIQRRTATPIGKTLETHLVVRTSC